jgi:hypothetical protein
VIEPGIRIGGKICIFRKDFVGRYVFLKLHKKAVAADVDNKGVEWLHRIELILCDIALAKGGHAEVNNLGKWATAESAFDVAIH